MGQITTLTTDVTAPVNFVLMRGLLNAAKRTFPYYNGTMPGQLMKSGGSMSVKWRRIENLAAATTALGEVTGNTAFQLGRTAARPTITDITVAIAKYGNFFNLTEEIDLFNVNSKSAQLFDNLGENAGHSLNLLMRNVLDAETTDVWAGSAAATVSVVAAVTAGTVRRAVNRLNRNSAMKFFPMGTGSQNVTTSTIRASYFGICHPDVEEDLRDITGFIGVEQYGGYTETFVGEFGAVGGVRFASTEIAPIATAAGTTTASGFRQGTSIQNDVYSTFIYGREAIGSVGLGENLTEKIYMGGDQIPAVEMIQTGLGSAGAGDPFKELNTLAWKSWFAGKVLNGDWLMKIESLATDWS